MAAKPPFHSPRLGHFLRLSLFILSINLNLGNSSCSVFNELSLPMSHFERQSVSLDHRQLLHT